MPNQQYSLEEELAIFRNVNSFKKKVKNMHTNMVCGNHTRDALFNQGISRAKLKEFTEKEGVDFESWRTF